MSHQDTDCRTGSGTYAQELRNAIRSLLATVHWQDVQFRKDCQWTPFGLVAAALVWAWSSKVTLKERFSQAHRFASGLGRRCAPRTTSYQAFMKLLVRWTVPLVGRLVLAFQVLMEREFPREFRFAGFVILAGDGSKLRLARTRSNEARYSPATRGKKGKKRRQADRSKRRPRSAQARAQQAKDKKADSPQMALTLLYHVLLRLPWDWRIGSSDTSEREQLRAMIPALPADALITADCGFVGYDFWSELLASGRAFVIRVGGNVRLLRKLGVVRESQGIIYLWPAKAAEKKQPPLVLRLVVVHDGRRSWYLVTSVLSTKRLSDEQVTHIYRLRWRIELFFRHFKQTYGRAKLRSHKAEHTACEAQWSLLGLWTMLLHTQIQHKCVCGKARHVSVAEVLRAFGQTIDEQSCRPQTGEALADKLLAALVDPYRRRNKTSRAYPRKKYEPPAKPPRIATATRSQRQLAKWVMKQKTQKGQRRRVAFFCTKADATVAQILEAVADRAAIEQDFHDVKEVHGAGQQQVRNYWANIAVYHLNLWLHTLIEWWAWDQSHAQLCDRSHSPWDDPDRRPSHADRRNALRRWCLDNAIRRGGGRRGLTPKIRTLMKGLLSLVT